MNTSEVLTHVEDISKSWILNMCWFMENTYLNHEFLRRDDSYRRYI
jgi:hypothetical protein